jgi:hypothetical protein
MIKLCLQRSAECRRCAERRQSWLEWEGRWFFLARSYDNQRRGDRSLHFGGHQCEDGAKSARPSGGQLYQILEQPIVLSSQLHVVRVFPERTVTHERKYEFNRTGRNEH